MATPSIHIARAKPGDASLVSDLSNITFIQTYQGTCSDEDLQEFIDQCFNTEVILRELQEPEEYYFLAFSDGLPVGYMRLKEDYRDYPDITKNRALELKRIYVLNDYHSQGIGAMLMEFAIEFALEKDFEAIWLGVWEENNRAIQFYKRFGFEDTGARNTFYIGKTAQMDHWMMKKL